MVSNELLAAPNFQCGLVAIELGHLAVHKDKVVGRPVLARSFERFEYLFPVGYPIDCEADLSDLVERYFLIDDIIFGDQNTVRSSRRRSGRGEAWCSAAASRRT